LRPSLFFIPHSSFRNGLEPVKLKAAPEVCARSMQHHPQVVHLDIQKLANLFALETVNLAQSEGARNPLRQRREAILKDIPELVLLDQLFRVRMPLARPQVSVLRLDGCDPVPRPFTFLHKKLFVLKLFAFAVLKDSLTALAAIEVCDLVLEYANEPRALRASTTETLVSLQRGEQSLLYDIFRL